MFSNRHRFRGAQRFHLAWILFGMPFPDFTHRHDRSNGNYVYCGPLIYILHISVFLRDPLRARIGMRLASYCSLGDLLRQPVFCGVVDSKRRFELDSNALAIEQLCEIRIGFSCWTAGRILMRARINLYYIFSSSLIDLFTAKINFQKIHDSYIC